MEVALKGMGALCLTDLIEGKRGKVPWKWLWRGLVRFVYRIQRRESAVWRLGSVSDGDQRALPIGFLGGKAR